MYHFLSFTAESLIDTSEADSILDHMDCIWYALDKKV